MSTTIDERVVEMRFDNQKFEQNVKTSMSTIEKLKNVFLIGTIFFMLVRTATLLKMIESMMKK